MKHAAEQNMNDCKKRKSQISLGQEKLTECGEIIQQKGIIDQNLNSTEITR